MKILHLCLSASFVDGLSYQENLLSQYHKKMGNEVFVISSLVNINDKGQYILDKEAHEYVNEHGVFVSKLAYRLGNKLGKLLRIYKGTYAAIEKAAPDVIFVHGVQFMDAGVLVKYLKKHPSVKVFADNHADFSNSATNWLSKNILHKLLWRSCAQRLLPFVTKFYGVLPARVDFLKDVYGLPEDKIELLVMGADDELAMKAENPDVKSEIRERYGIAEDDFLIINGGKIDLFKKQTLLLMDAVNAIEDKRVKLIVFGSIVPELKEEINNRLSDRVQYIGWVRSDDSYDYFAASDLAVFPGRHSVFWEQVAGQGIPMICKRWAGTDHVNVNGNVVFLETDTVDEIKAAIVSVMENYDSMKAAAEKSRRTFAYSDIAKRSII